MNTAIAAADPHAYLPYYGLHAPPFLARRGHDCWVGGRAAAVMEALAEAIGKHDGMFVVTGDVGAGKTSLAHSLIEGAGQPHLLIRSIPGPGGDVAALFAEVAQAFGITERCTTKAAFVPQFLQLLRVTHSSGQRAVLLIDDAQRLNDRLVRELCDLSIVAMALQYPLAIVLIGLGDLDAVLSEAEDTDLTQRIVGRWGLDPLTLGEVAEYVDHRLRAVGAERQIFSRDAVEAIASISRGAPGLINTVCHRALMVGYGRRAYTIGRDLVEDSFGKVAESARTLPARTSDRGVRSVARSLREDVGVPARRVPGKVVLGVFVISLAALLLGHAVFRADWFVQSHHDSVGAVGRDPEPRVTDQPVASWPEPSSRVAVEPVASWPEPSPASVNSQPADRAGVSLTPGRTKLAPSAAAQRRSSAGPAPRTARAERSDESGNSPDGTAIIDWLLKERSPGQQ